MVLPQIEYQRFEEQIKPSEGSLLTETDADMRAMIGEEFSSLRPLDTDLTLNIEEQLLIDPSEDFDNMMLEIRGGTAGEKDNLRWYSFCKAECLIQRNPK